MNRRVSNVLHGQIKDHSNNTLSSLSPVTWLLNLFAINTNVIKATPCTTTYNSFKTIFTFTILESLNIFSLYFKYAYIYKEISMAKSIQLTDTVQMLYNQFQYFIDLWFINKCGRHLSQEYFKQYEHIDTILDMVHYDAIKRELIKLLIFFSFIWIMTSIVDFVSWYLSYGWIPPTNYSVAYLFLFIKILTMLDLSSHVMQIRFRLMIIGDMVQNYYSAMESLTGFKDSYTDRKYGNITGKPHTIDMSRANTKLRSTDDESIRKEIELLTRCYLQLTEQVAFINSIFGFRMLLNSLSLLIDIIIYTNMAVRILIGSHFMPNESRYFPVASSLMRQLVCVLVLISLVNQCESVYSQQERIVTIVDHLLTNKNPSDMLKRALTELRSLIQAHPVNFSLVNFFRLDNSFLVSVASVVVTYTIILIQSVN